MFEGVDDNVTNDFLQRQFGQDTQSEAGFHHGNDRLVINGEVDQVRLNAVVIQRGLGVPVVVAGLQDKVEVGEVVPGHRVAVGGNEALGCHTVDFILNQAVDDQPVLVNGQDDEADVQGPVFNVADNLVEAGLTHGNIDTRVLALERLNDRRQPVDAHRRKGADADEAGVQPVDVVGLLLQAGNVVENLLDNG